MGELSGFPGESGEPVPATWYLRLFRRQKKNAASASATTPSVTPTDMPATAPAERPLLLVSLSLLSLLVLLGSLFESAVAVAAVESEPVVPAVAVLSPVDSGGYDIDQRRSCMSTVC